MGDKIRNFTDLHVWQKAHILVQQIYEITSSFPKEEVFGLTSQIRRASISVTSNIAEGFGRSTAKDKSHFYMMAQASLSEVQNQLLVAKDIHYIPEKSFNILYTDSIVVARMLNALIQKTRLFPASRF